MGNITMRRALSWLESAGRCLVDRAVHHVVLAILIWLLIVAVVAVFGATVLDLHDHFQSLAGYIFTCAALAIAGVAALSAMVSSILAYEAHRPFLNVLQPVYYDVVRNNASHFTLRQILFRLENSGSLPADSVSVDCHICREDESDDTQLLPASAVPSIIFPGGATPHVLQTSAYAYRPAKNGASPLRVNIRIAYVNKLRRNRQLFTRRSYLIGLPQYEGRGECEPLPRGNSWN